MSKRKLTTEVLLKLYARMIKHASICRYHSPEDIASEYVCRLMEGLHKKATVGQAYIDILRTLHANSRSKYYQDQLNLQRGVDKSDYILSVIEDKPDLNVDDRIALMQVLSRIKSPKLQFIFKMKLNGFTNGEIAEKMDVTESYVHQLLKKEFIRLKEPASGEF